MKKRELKKLIKEIIVVKEMSEEEQDNESFHITSIDARDSDLVFKGKMDHWEAEKTVWQGKGFRNAENELDKFEKANKNRQLRYHLKNADGYCCKQCGEPFFNQNKIASICGDCQGQNAAAAAEPDMINENFGEYCPKCKSRLYSGDDEYMDKAGVCSSCVTYDNTSDKRFYNKYVQATKAEKPSKKDVKREEKEPYADQIQRQIRKAAKERNAEAVVFYSDAADKSASSSFESWKGSAAYTGWKERNKEKIAKVEAEFKRFSHMREAGILRGPDMFPGAASATNYLSPRRGEVLKEPLDIGDSFYIHKTGMDANGNYSVWVSLGANPAKKIQTNGNTPAAHQKKSAEIASNEQAKREIKDYYNKYLKKESVQETSNQAGKYKGWDINYYPIGSQHWKASRSGVNMTSNSKESLKQMIDDRKPLTTVKETMHDQELCDCGHYGDEHSHGLCHHTNCKCNKFTRNDMDEIQKLKEGIKKYIRGIVK